MAVLFSYPIKSTLVNGDLILISDSEDGDKTKNASISAVKNAINVVDTIIPGQGISVSSPTGDVTIGNTGVTSLTPGPNISLSGSTGAITIGSTASYVLPAATSTALGGIKIIGPTVTAVTQTPTTDAGRTYGVQLNAGGGAVVNVPWTGTTSAASASNIGGIKLFSDIVLPAITSTVNPPVVSKNYGVQINALGQAGVHVPWENTTDITLTTIGTSGVATWNGTTLNIPQYIGTDTTYSLSASQPSANKVELLLDASATGTDSFVSITSSDNSVSVSMFNNEIDLKSSGGSTGVSSFTNANGTFISAATQNTSATGAVSMGNIDLSAIGTKDDTTFLRGDNTWSPPPANGFNTFSIYSATFPINLPEGDPPFTIARQSVCETDCTIGAVSFMRFDGQGPVSVFVYKGNIRNGGALVLQGSQDAPHVAPDQNQPNTIVFRDTEFDATTYKFSAGEEIVIVVSMSSSSAVGGVDGVTIAGSRDLISNQFISRTDQNFYVPSGFNNPNPMPESLEEWTNGTSEVGTKSGYALHFHAG
jgi:hypothetical protein